MLDPKLLRNDLQQCADQLSRRGYKLEVESLQSLEEQRKQLQVSTQELQAERNAKSKAIGQAKAKGEDTTAILEQVADLGDKLKQAESRLNEIQQQLDEILLGIPNIPQPEVPEGKDENDNVEIRRWGEPR
ncbi:MAG: serine--tRNA ligase, partial [Thiohalophilus sp.]